MCGDHLSNNVTRARTRGITPHVRGPRFEFFPELGYVGITACAGTTWDWRTFGDGNGDHPRMCGDHYLIIILIFLPVGSPPHVRGPLRATIS